MARSVDGLGRGADALVPAEEKRESRPRIISLGGHAGHVLRVEKGNRAVKGLQRHSAGCTAPPEDCRAEEYIPVIAKGR
jgi:hypothetical protein